MIGEPLDWLPIDVVRGSMAKEALRGAVEVWSRQWFLARPMGLSDAVVYPKGSSNSDGGWRRYGGSIAISSSPLARARLLGWLLDTDLPSDLSLPDREICDGLEATLLTDLSAKAGGALGLQAVGFTSEETVSSPLAANGGAIVEITDDRGDALLRLAIPLGAYVSFYKRSPAGPRADKAALESVRIALASTPVVVEATLGRAKIDVSELQGLAAGDIIVLDKGLEGSIDIVALGGGPVIAKASLAHLDGQITLTLQP